MAKNFVQVGENLTLPVKDNVKSGELVQVGNVIGIALTDAKTDDGTKYYTTIATKGVWNLTVKAPPKADGVVSTTPKGGSEDVPVGFAFKAGDVVSTTPNGGSGDIPVGFALEDVTYSSTCVVVPVLLCLGLAYGAAKPVSA